MSLPLPLDPGTILDSRYKIGALINSGGFGAVYRAIDTSEADRPCAIKETYEFTSSVRRQAMTEAGILLTVRSRHLPQVYDAFPVNDRFYLVMQLIEGQNLQQLLKTRQHPCSEQEVVTWLLPIMQIMQELHSRTPAVLHRDIKPGNIILTPDETAVLVDFGLTKLYDPESTQTMVRAVSEGFSPIEQYVGKTSVQSDIYSLAATMYFLLTRQIPPLSINRSLHEELVAPRLLNPALSPKIEQVLLKALAVDPGQRYQSMQAFAQALQESNFTAHADPTIAVNKIHPATTSPQPVSSSIPSGPSTNMQSMQPLLSQFIPPPPPPPSPSTYSISSPPSYPVSPPYMTTPPPGYVLVRQSDLVVQPPLPSAFGQGCLWGLLQGIVAAFLLLALKEVDVYVALVIGSIGSLLYLCAGFRTTRKGGSFDRGGWAGFWAGITSILISSIILGLGHLVFVLTPHDQGGLPANKLTGAFGAFDPLVLGQPTAIVTFLVVILILAIGCGLLGGWLGKRSYESTLKKKGVRT